MSILNKTLRTIPASMLTGALPMYEASLEKVTVTDFVKDNFLVVSVMLITFFGMIWRSSLSRCAGRASLRQTPRKPPGRPGS